MQRKHQSPRYKFQIIWLLFLVSWNFRCRASVGLGFSLFARHYLGNYFCSLFLRLLRCFTSPSSRSDTRSEQLRLDAIEFPHSEIPGSQVATHLPEAYRSYAPSFIALLCQGIHHLPLIYFPS